VDVHVREDSPQVVVALDGQVGLDEVCDLVPAGTRKVVLATALNSGALERGMGVAA
jgi:hypothetical protein